MNEFGLREVMIVAGSLVSGLLTLYLGWGLWVYRAILIRFARAIWSRYVAHLTVDTMVETIADRPVSAFPGTAEMPVPAHSDAETDAEMLVPVSADDLLISRLAALVLAEKLDQPSAIRIGLQAPTGRAYMAAKARLEAEMDRQRYPTLTQAGRPLRTAARH